MRDAHGPDPVGSPLVRLLQASFRLGWIRGTEVRAYWLALLVMPLILLEGTGWLPAWERWAYVLLLILLLYGVILTHEFGHVRAGRRYGIVTPLVTLSPLGGVAHMSAAAPGPKAEIRVSLMGPLTHLGWLAVFAPLSWWVVPEPGDGWIPPGAHLDYVWLAVDVLVTLNLGLLCFNLLPCFPMDGGRVLRAALALRMHPNRATLHATTVGLLGAAAFGAVGLVGWVSGSGLFHTVLLVIGISNALACVQERRAARFTPGPYLDGGRLAPWESDADAWKRGAAGGAGSRPSRWARWRAGRAEARARREALARQRLQVEVDRILDKVRAEGMASLTARERATLEQASDAWRR